MLAYDRAPLRLRAFYRESSSLRGIVAAGGSGSAEQNPDPVAAGSLREGSLPPSVLHG